MIVIGSHAALARGDYDFGRPLDKADIDLLGTRDEGLSLCAHFESTEPVRIIDLGHKLIVRRLTFAPVKAGPWHERRFREYAHQPVSLRVMPDAYLETLGALADNLPVEIFGFSALAISPITNSAIKRSLHGISTKAQHAEDVEYLRSKNYFGFTMTPAHAEFMRVCRERLLWQSANGMH